MHKIFSVVFLCLQLTFDLWVYYLYIVYSLLENFFRFFFPVRRKSLDDDIILVTGSAIGIGRAICLQLAAKTKAKLVLWDVKQEENAQLAEILRQFGTRAWAYHVDLSSRPQIESAAEKVISIKIKNKQLKFWLKMSQ